MYIKKVNEEYFYIKIFTKNIIKCRMCTLLEHTLQTMAMYKHAVNVIEF